MKISGEHTTLTYTFLFSSAKNTYETGIENLENSFYYFLASIVMSAFSFEAYMNHCGIALFDDLLIDDFNLFERKKPLEKFKIVSSLINLKIDIKTSPYKSLPL